MTTRTVVEGVEGLLCEPVHEFVLGGTPRHIATQVTKEANARYFSGDKKQTRASVRRKEGPPMTPGLSDYWKGARKLCDEINEITIYIVCIFSLKEVSLLSNQANQRAPDRNIDCRGRYVSIKCGNT